MLTPITRTMFFELDEFQKWVESLRARGIRPLTLWLTPEQWTRLTGACGFGPPPPFHKYLFCGVPIAVRKRECLQTTKHQ